MPGPVRSARYWMPILFVAGAPVGMGLAQEPSRPSSGGRFDRPAAQRFVAQYCTSCHNGTEKKGDLDLEAVGSEDVAARPVAWEKVARKLAARQMPPAGSKRPDDRTYTTFVATLEAELDLAAAKRPDPGRTPTLRRLN